MINLVVCSIVSSYFPPYTDTVPQVTCRQLGFSLAVAVTTESMLYGVDDDDDDVRVWVEGVECVGGESDIGECVGVGDWGVVSSECDNHTRDAGVICAGIYTYMHVHHTHILSHTHTRDTHTHTHTHTHRYCRCT